MDGGASADYAGRRLFFNLSRTGELPGVPHDFLPPVCHLPYRPLATGSLAFLGRWAGRVPWNKIRNSTAGKIRRCCRKFPG
jgi:hypothetical protein